MTAVSFALVFLGMLLFVCALPFSGLSWPVCFVLIGFAMIILGCYIASVWGHAMGRRDLVHLRNSLARAIQHIREHSHAKREEKKKARQARLAKQKPLGTGST